MFAFLNNLSISEGLKPDISSCLASSISSADIRASRCLFSSSMLCIFGSLEAPTGKELPTDASLSGSDATSGVGHTAFPPRFED